MPEHSEAEVAYIGKALSRVCSMQKTYGMKAPDLGQLIEAIIFICADYSAQEIIEAIRVYVRNNSDIPTPNDLLDILDPQFKPNHEMYKSIMRNWRVNGKESISLSDEEYVRIYEKHEKENLGL